jgi:hypothetical protein
MFKLFKYIMELQLLSLPLFIEFLFCINRPEFLCRIN